MPSTTSGTRSSRPSRRQELCALPEGPTRSPSSPRLSTTSASSSARAATSTRRRPTSGGRSRLGRLRRSHQQPRSRPRGPGRRRGRHCPPPAVPGEGAGFRAELPDPGSRSIWVRGGSERGSRSWSCFSRGTRRTRWPRDAGPAPGTAMRSATAPALALARLSGGASPCARATAPGGGGRGRAGAPGSSPSSARPPTRLERAAADAASPPESGSGC